MTGNIVMEMGYATGLHREALIATGVVLFVFILIINLLLFAHQKEAERDDRLTRNNRLADIVAVNNSHIETIR